MNHSECHDTFCNRLIVRRSLITVPVDWLSLACKISCSNSCYKLLNTVTVLQTELLRLTAVNLICFVWSCYQWCSRNKIAVIRPPLIILTNMSEKNQRIFFADSLVLELIITSLIEQVIKMSFFKTNNEENKMKTQRRESCENCTNQSNGNENKPPHTYY